VNLGPKPDRLLWVITSHSFYTRSNCCFRPQADVESRVSQSGSTISTRCIPGPQPSVVVEAVLAPNFAKNGADFWLAAIRTIFASDVRPNRITRSMILEPIPIPCVCGSSNIQFKVFASWPSPNRPKAPSTRPFTSQTSYPSDAHSRKSLYSSRSLGAKYSGQFASKMLVQTWLSKLQYGLKVTFFISLSNLQVTALDHKQPFIILAVHRPLTATSGRYATLSQVNVLVTGSPSSVVVSS